MHVGAGNFRHFEPERPIGVINDFALGVEGVRFDVTRVGTVLESSRNNDMQARVGLISPR
jgi:hypothetical protein